jgi:NAD(P)-dependent dehydrogenase (short-subunit alcohol dehydrogenase family)
VNLGLQDMVACVVGGTRGIGLATVDILAEEGCRVHACARDERRLNDLAHVRRQIAHPICWDRADVTNAESVRSWLGGVRSLHGRIDVLVHTVSAQSSDWSAGVQTDILSTVAVVDATLPLLSCSGHASIVLVASQAGSMAVPSYKAYSACKAALISFAAALAKELAPRAIRVNCVSPSEVLCPDGFWAARLEDDPALVARTLGRHPSGRFCSPDEVARVIAFLASPAASYVSGENLAIDFASREFVHF